MGAQPLNLNLGFIGEVLSSHSQAGKERQQDFCKALDQHEQAVPEPQCAIAACSEHGACGRAFGEETEVDGQSQSAIVIGLWLRLHISRI